MAAASSSEEDEDPLTLSKLSFGSPHAKKNKGGVVVADDNRVPLPQLESRARRSRRPETQRTQRP